MLDDHAWVISFIIAGCGLLLGELGGRLVRNHLDNEERAPEVRAQSRAAGSFVFWSATATGVLLAVAFTSRETLEELRVRTNEIIPDVALSGLVLFGGYALAMGVSAAVGQSVRAATGVRHESVERTLRWTIVAMAVLIAGSTLGADSAVIGVLAGLILIGPVLSVSLLTGLGAREVASHLSAGRALRGQLHVGEWLSSGSVEGCIVALHPTGVEVEQDDGEHRHVAFGTLMNSSFGVRPTRSRTEI